jgi:hypothetical protein
MGTSARFDGTYSSARRLSAFVLKGQLQARAVFEDFAVLDLHIHLHDLGNA